ncbi:membrane-associated protein, putative [Bodo saltans]|uniref:Membrane-associated protein, putative n=1 Tax=Bodo saltans TaxID=75058 RepID=A0A0S4JZD1_BODSA|nr:membrane-associated protein, putative [Bodo saltans]|eukprot:CUG93938.1 membrane-associated protein, putative [Bodo saltans]
MMQHSSATMLVAVCFVLLACFHSTGVSAATQQNYTITANRNTGTPLNFKRILGKNYPPGGVVFINKLPEHGTLVGVRGNEVAIGGSTDGNTFTYRSNPDFPADGVKVGLDTIGFRAVAQGGDEVTGFLTIRVTLRELLIKNYTLRATDSTTPLKLQLRARRQSNAIVSLKDRTLLSVQIETLPTNGCIVKQADGTVIASAPTKVVDALQSVLVLPAPEMQVGESCTFSYSATRNNSISSKPAFVTLTRVERGTLKPRAYNTNSVYNVDFDVSRMLELVGSTRIPDSNLTFIITKLPAFGQVHDVMDTTTTQLPEFGFNASSLPITLYVGPKTRIVLVYQVSPTLVPNATTVSLEYIVKDKFATSAPAKVNIILDKKGSPVCGDVVISPVFWDRPVKDIVLNFTNPNARTVQKLILMKTPAKPLGDLLYSRTTLLRQRKIRLQPGSYFSDKDNRLSYQVRPSMKRTSGNETYLFRVQNFDGMSCVGKVTFIVMQHDAQVVNDAKLNVRREIVRLNGYTLLPLWGTANKTIVKPSSVILSTSPTYGSIYQLTEDAPYDAGRMYRVNLLGQARSYCVRRNCEDYRGAAVNSGDTVVRKELWAEEGLTTSTRFWILYKAPASLPEGTTLNTFTDTFEYHFFNDAGQMSEVQRVTISFRKAIKRVVECRYTVNDLRNLNFDRQQQTFIKCVLSNATNQAVMIPEFDKYRRHGAEVNFRMFQFRQDGNRIYTGDRLANTSRDNVVGMWLDKQNTVLVVPSARARTINFQFRAMIYNLTSSGVLAPLPELVRVRVIRDNTPPFWNYDYITGGGALEVPTGVTQTIDVTAEDLEDDLLQFRLAQGVSKGVLYFEDLRFGVGTLTIVKTGSVMRVPKGAISRQTARFYYKVDSREGWTYPQYDNFTLYADDGGGVLSPALVYNITITSDANAHMSRGTSFTVSYSTVVFALLTVVAVLLITLAAVLRRRGKNKYMSLPTDTEMHGSAPRPNGIQ